MKKEPSLRNIRRRERLAELVEEAGGATALALLVGTPKSYISAMGSGSRGVGDEIAARLERVMEKPPGWMDEPAYGTGGSPSEPVRLTGNFAHEPTTTGYADLPISGGMAKVTGVARVGLDGFFEEEPYADGTGGWVPAPWQRGAYALRVKGDGLAPMIENGKFLLVARGAKAEPGEEVVITFKDGRKAVRKLIIQRTAELSVIPVQGGTPQTIDLADVEGCDPVFGIISARSWVESLATQQPRRALPRPTRGGNAHGNGDEDGDGQEASK